MLPAGRSVSLAILLLLLPSCALRADDPANPPRRGQWSDVTTIDRVTFNDVTIPTSELPGNFAEKLDRMEKDEKVCGEPYTHTREEVETLLNERMTMRCRIEDFTRTPFTLESLARCEPFHADGHEVIPTLRADATVSTDAINLNMRIIMRLPTRAGYNSMAVISGRRIMKRIGDC